MYNFFDRMTFWNKPFSGVFLLHNLESSNFLRRCKYIERKTPPKNISELYKHFSSRLIHKLFLDHPVHNHILP